MIILSASAAWQPARAAALLALAISATLLAAGEAAAAEKSPKLLVAGHPRLYFTADDLPKLRSLRTQGEHARIWANLARSANWCAQQKPRQEWIPTIAPDPIYENLYDRFYAAMHDMAIVEHLAFASILSDPRDDKYFAPAREWALAVARIWRNEAANKPDQSKAYAVLRVMKSLAVAYDLLHPRLKESERAEIRGALAEVGRAYFVFFADPVAAGAGYNKHHGSVDAAPFGVVALALLGEVPEAAQWLAQMVEKHTGYLLEHALTPSGTNDQSSNFWASTLHYRIFFLDALKRVTGRDLFAEFPDALPGRIALAAVAGPHPAELRFNELHRSVLFGPCYGQLDYWSPALFYLARRERRPIHQHLAAWDRAAGALQRTRYVTPHKKEELLFSFGGYIYVWYDPSVSAEVEADLPRSFEFPEPEVNEAYLRDGYRAGQIVVGMRKGDVVVHAGRRPVYVDYDAAADPNTPAKPVEQLLLADDGRSALIRCMGPTARGIGEQRVELRRPGRLTIRRKASKPIAWWYAGSPAREGNRLVWQDGTTLSVTRGTLERIDEQGYTETKVHYGGMKFDDPHPFVYPVVVARPADGVLEVEITRKENP